MKECKILIVDDDLDDVEILSSALQDTGVDRVHYEHTAMQAFIYLESIQLPAKLPKLIVIDAYLPGITGAEFLADLKQMELYKAIHVIVLSTLKTEKEIERYRQLGAIDYLVKPNSYEEYVKVAADIKSKIDL
ncbi:MAG TPA: response regulator [Chitinophagaceae bacterium]|nr:response regulator [Chitinophagaceae bacterium]